MKNKILVVILILLLSGSLFFYCSFHKNQTTPQGFAPVDVVYHGSPNSNIKIFEPKDEHIRNKDEGAVVFATPSLRVASCYVFKWDDTWVHQSISWKNGNKADYQVIMVISDRTRFEQKDHGGTIYILPAQDFRFDEHRGLGIYEWTHKKPVRPMLQINFSSGLEAMQKSGVQVYFVEPNQFQHYLSLPGEEQEKFLLGLKNRKPND